MEQTHPFYVVLAAGGIGMRMGTDIPKQYLSLHNKPLALYSFEVFLSLPEVLGIVVVCDPAYQSLFTPYSKLVNLSFALPGKRRQDSVYNGIEKLTGDPLVCVHDAARPLINSTLVRRAVHAAAEWQAAVLGVSVKGTIKVCDADQNILNTPNRASLWEVQTPQVIRLSLLREGFEKANSQSLTVTDDVSLVELLGKTVKVVESSYSNIKITTPEDLLVIKQFLN